MNNGIFSPIVGISTDNEVLVIEAIKNGIRTFDTSIKCNQEAIGNGVRKAIADGIVKRSELFIITKVADIHHDRIQESLKFQLEKLQLDYSGKPKPELIDFKNKQFRFAFTRDAVGARRRK